MVVEARRDLEPIMARHAAARIGPDMLTRLTESVDAMRSNLGEREIFLSTNQEFHEIIALASGNSMYGFLIDALVGIVDGTVMGVDYPAARRDSILKAHERILSSLVAHDGDASHDAMSEHMTEFVKYMQRKYADVLGRTVTWDAI
jgi:DNA-binding FadR family transcriptional regulator